MSRRTCRWCPGRRATTGTLQSSGGSLGAGTKRDGGERNVSRPPWMLRERRSGGGGGEREGGRCRGTAYRRKRSRSRWARRKWLHMSRSLRYRRIHHSEEQAQARARALGGSVSVPVLALRGSLPREHRWNLPRSSSRTRRDARCRHRTATIDSPTRTECSDGPARRSTRPRPRPPRKCRSPANTGPLLPAPRAPPASRAPPAFASAPPSLAAAETKESRSLGAAPSASDRVVSAARQTANS